MINILKHYWHILKLYKKNQGFNISYLSEKSSNKVHMNVDKVVVLDSRFTFEGSNNTIIIEDGCMLYGVWFFITGNNNTLHIGKNTYIYSSSNKQTMLSPCYGTKITIGENCLFANDIEVQTCDHHPVLVEGEQVNIPKDIHIGNHCWIAAHTSIMKGTVIADDCVIGAKSLVNKDFSTDSHCVIAGVPAKVVKRGIDWKL